MQVFDRYVSARGLTVFGFEIGLISGAMLLAAFAHGSLDATMAAAWKLTLVTAVCVLCFYYNDLYDLTLVHSPLEFFVRLLRATGMAALLLAIATVAAPGLIVGHGVLITWLLLVLVAVPAWRMTFNGVAHAPRLEENVLFVGHGPGTEKVVHRVAEQHDFAYHVAGVVDEPFDDLPRLVERLNIHRIVVGVSDRRGHLPIQELLRAKLAGVRVEDAATMYERITGKLMVDDLTPSWLVFSDGFRSSRTTRLLKRTIDIGLAAVGLVMAAPLMLLTALAVRLESPGPILYRQERVGERGRPFTLAKFRSMRTDAEAGTPIWASEHDDRVTRVGRFIRKTRLDELPQLWNVLRGEMSFVGPRPERPYFVRQLSEAVPFYAERHVVKPGVTGWAQVKYRYGCSIEDAIEKLRYDLYYIKHQSIIFDFTIVIDTVKVIVSGKGAQ